MPPFDFRTSQIQTKQIIATGSFDGLGANSQIAIYPIEAEGSPANQGEISAGLLAQLDATDVFLFISGGIGEKDGTNRATTVFGGDIHISGNMTIDGTLHFSQSIFTDIAISSSSRDLANSDSGKVAFVNTTGGNVTFVASGSILSTGWSTMLVREGANSLIISGTAATTLVGPAVTAGAVEITVDYGGVSMVKRSDAIIWCAGVTS